MKRQVSAAVVLLSFSQVGDNDFQNLLAVLLLLFLAETGHFLQFFFRCREFFYDSDNRGRTQDSDDAFACFLRFFPPPFRQPFVKLRMTDAFGHDNRFFELREGCSLIVGD